MLGLIIFGTRGVTSEQGQGEFFCPRCRGRRPYVHKACRRFFTLYFIPLIPLNLVGEYIECQSCQGTYKMEALQHDPEAETRRVQLAFCQTMSRVLAVVSEADGPAGDAEIDAIAAVLHKLGDREVSRADIETKLVLARASRIDLVQCCREMKEYLADSGCELVVRSVIQIAYVDGPLADRERTAVERIASLLQLPRDRLTALLSQASQERRDSAGAAPSSPS